MAGMMLHMDASTHAWLGDERDKRDLIYVLDDATGEALYGAFVPEEDTRTCLRALQAVLESRGLFSEFYTDRGSHFVRTPVAGGDVSEEGVGRQRIGAPRQWLEPCDAIAGSTLCGRELPHS